MTGNEMNVQNRRILNSKSWKRFRWHIYRSPLAKLIKALRRVALRREIDLRRHLLKELPNTPILAERSRQLVEQGYTIVTDIVDPAGMLALSEAAREKLDRAKFQTGNIRQDAHHKDFWVRLLDEDKVNGALPVSNPFVSVVLQPEIMSIVSNAFGEVPRLDYVLLTLSKHTGKSQSFSQLWHRDHDDTRVIKFFIYLTDVVSTEDGPFTFIPGPQSDQVGFQIKSHLTDEEIGMRIPFEAITEMKAPRLSAFIVDTKRCLHMGSRLSAGHDRLLYTATFISSPRLFPEPPPCFILRGDESLLLKCLLSAKLEGKVD